MYLLCEYYQQTLIKTEIAYLKNNSRSIAGVITSSSALPSKTKIEHRGRIKTNFPITTLLSNMKSS